MGKIALVVVLLVLLGCDAADPGSAPDDDWRLPKTLPASAESPFAPLPAEVRVYEPARAIGEQLFVDKNLSDDRQVACIDCHPFDKGGADGMTFPCIPARLKGAQINTGTIFNLVHNALFNWDGNFSTLHDQLGAPMESHHVMRISWDAMTTRVNENPAYVKAFAEAYPEGATLGNIRDAIVQYERSLITPNAPFDRYLRGEEGSGFTKAALDGFKLFKELGCATCHQGINLGGNMFAELGVMGDYFKDREQNHNNPIKPKDTGRCAHTHQQEHCFQFRVPSLRNVDRTKPYFHDGTQETLYDAIETMALYQLGRVLDKDEVMLLAAFLQSLNGELPPPPRGAPTSSEPPAACASAEASSNPQPSPSAKAP